MPAARVSRIKISPTTAAAARVRELKAAGHDIVDMTIGEPDFDTPDHVKAAAHAAIDRGETKYTAVNGTPALRTAIIGDYKRRLGLDYAENEICVGGGAKQILFLALMASVEDGAEVIIPAPYWVSYPDMVIANDGKPVIVAVLRRTSGLQTDAGRAGGRDHATDAMADPEHALEPDGRGL